MGDTTILPLGAAAQEDNDPHRLDYIRKDQYDRPVSARVSASEIRALVLAVVVIAPSLLAVLSLIQLASCWGQQYDLSAGCTLATGLFWLYIIALVAGALSAVLVAVWGRLARVRAEIARASITRDRYSNPVSVAAIHRQDQRMVASYFVSAQQAEIAMAPYKMLPAGLDAYNVSQPAVKADAPALTVSAEQVISLVSDEGWLPWLLDVPHTMIAGSSGTGKTTLARVALAERLRAGYSGLVVDPKGKEWFGLPVVGGGRKFGEILDALASVHAEMGRRFEAYGAGERSFTPMVIVVDEVPDIMDACLDDRRRLVDGRWSRFVRQLGSLAREVQISVILLTQSPLVEDIGMNSAMRKNFSRIALGDEAPILIREERDPKRRAELQNLLRGQRYPAAMYRRGEVHLLDTANVPSLAERRVASPLAWQLSAPARADSKPKIAAYQAWARRLSADAWQAEVRRLASLPGKRRGGYALTIEQIRALVGRDQNTVAALCRDARGE